MSSNQTLILNAIDSRMATLLPTYTRMNYSYELEKNSYRSSNMKWGAGAGGAESIEGVMRSTTLNQEFFIVISSTFVNRSNDNGEVESLKDIYDAIDTVYRDFMSSKLGIPATVLVVESRSLDEPLKISENTISVKANFIIKHRKSNT